MSGFLSRDVSNHLPPKVAPEPVQFAGSIQPHGILLVLSNSELVVVQASVNVQEHLGILPQHLLGQPLSNLLEATSIVQIQQALNSPEQFRFSKLSFRTQLHHHPFNCTLYPSESGLMLELEAHHESHSFPQSNVRSAITRLRHLPDLTEFLQTATLEIRHLTQFDRVMVYQFDVEGAGAVIAEAKRDDLPSYLGLHYPATDIPASVRALYRQGLVRYIPDLTASAVDIIPAENPFTRQPLDLNHSALRSVDPCCVEYHQNMDVAALLVIALTQGDTLWGLLSCHHQTPKSVPYDLREDCELLVQLVASELANKVNLEEIGYLNKLRSLQSNFLHSISEADSLKQALVDSAPRLLDLVNAQGVAVCLEDEITLVGTTPTLDLIRPLLDWTETSSDLHSPIFHTHTLPKLYPEAIAFKESASGVLLLSISRVRRAAILWFRPEVLQTVNWAGDPNTTLTQAEDGTTILCPRKSFGQWQETVRFTSLPWKVCELESVLDLRSAIVGIILKKADELARVNLELENSIRELDSFAYAASHDLKEPLRGIHNYSNLLLKGYSDVLDESGQSRLQTLIRLTRRMETLIDALLKFSRLGQAELHLQPTDLNQILHQVLEELNVSRPDLPTEIRIPQPLPTVPCDPVLIHEVLSNLISNAIKYNDKPQPWVEIGSTPTPSPTFYIRDNGIGIRERHLDRVFRLFKRLHEQHLYGGGTGAGLTIAKKIIERHHGQVWVESTYGEGSTFYFTLNSPSPSS